MNFYKEHKRTILYFTGLFIVILSLLPYIIRGENIWVFFHDQLDGEVLNYIYRAKYLLKGTTIPEMMQGIPKTAMVPPAPFGVLFFKILPPFPAYVLLQAMVTLTAYSGMFLLAEAVTKDSRIGFLCGGLFAYLPFMPVYGLAIAGQPLLWWAFLNLYKERKKILSLCLIGIYAGFSSFVLVGFGVCTAVLTGIILLLFYEKTFKKQKILSCTGGFLVLCLTYLVCNWSLFSEVLAAATQTAGNMQSHRVEMVQTALTDYKGAFLECFLGKSTYTPAYAGWIFVITLLSMALCVLMKKRKQLMMPAGLLGVILLLTAAALLWQSEWCLATIRKAGPLAYFQADRITWLIPPLWYLLLGWDFWILFQAGERARHKGQKIAAYMGVLCLCSLTATVVYEHSFFYYQLRQVIFPDTYKIMTWQQYYATDVMEQIDTYIEHDLGKTKEQYRVVSLGMPPAAALYHGFYCLDGYSNNYPLEYKHAFRKVIEPELLKNQALKSYFDEWGNRCYLVSTESGSTPMINKYQATAYENLQLNTEALEALGCEYLFSAMEIKNCERLSLTLKGVFETPSSYYKVYVYSLEKVIQSNTGDQMTKG